MRQLSQFVAVFMLLPLMVIAQDKAGKGSSAAAGAKMFRSYCAACHGAEGTGNGPVGKALKTPPPDLTQMKAKNGGKFPAEKVAAAIEGNTVIAAHGGKDMPVWGEAFRPMSRDAAELKARIATITKHIESIQK